MTDYERADLRDALREQFQSLQNELIQAERQALDLFESQSSPASLNETEAVSVIEDAVYNSTSARQGARQKAARAATSGPRRRESSIVLEALNYLRGLPMGYARKVHGGSMGNAGEPDIDACVRGRAVKLEVKAAGNKPSVIQRAALHRWARAGALVGWFRTLTQLRELLDHLDDSAFEVDLSHPGCHCRRHRIEVTS